MKKLKKNQGFTLAELLVVIAILAILIAIAVPVFSGMVADANLRVNQANVRTVRSAAVAHILSNLDKEGDTLGAGTAKQLNQGLKEGSGWVAIAQVDNNGDIQTLMVTVRDRIHRYSSGIYAQSDMPKSLDDSKDIAAGTFENNNFFVLSDDVKNPFATVKPKGDGDRKTYWVQAVITDLDPAK